MNNYLTILSKVLQDLDPTQVAIHQIYLIPRGTGGFRWIFPPFNKEVWQYIKRWQPYSVKGKVQWILLLLFYRFGLLDYLPNVVKTNIKAPNLLLSSSTYIGTIGPHQKLVVSDINKQQIIKVAVGDRSHEKIRDEYHVLNELSQRSFNCPKALYLNTELDYFVQTIQPGHLTSPRLDKKHIELLNTMPICSKLECLDQIMPDWQDVIDKHSFINSDLHQLTIPSDIKMIWQHGDFCPWNILKFCGKYYLIDFEEARSKGLPLYDYLYFHVRKAQCFPDSGKIILRKLDLIRFLHQSRDIFSSLKLNQAYMIYLAIKNDDIEFARFANNVDFDIR